MKYSIPYKITSILLATLVVFSSLSFNIEKHACEGEVITSLFKKGEELCALQTPDCHNDVSSSCCSEKVESTNCCMDSSEFIQGISIEVQTSSEQKISLQPVLILISTFFYSNFLFEDKVISSFLLQKSILKSIDIGLLFQVFRI